LLLGLGIIDLLHQRLPLLHDGVQVLVRELAELIHGRHALHRTRLRRLGTPLQQLLLRLRPCRLRLRALGFIHARAVRVAAGLHGLLEVLGIPRLESATALRVIRGALRLLLGLRLTGPSECRHFTSPLIAFGP
jgi:hypothetical protein